MIEKLEYNEKFDLQLFLEKDTNGHLFRIVKSTISKLNKTNSYSKFYYFSAIEDGENFFEMILFKASVINKQEAYLIYNYIIDAFEKSIISNLKESIKYIQLTFGRSLGFTKEKVIGKIGELLFILKCQKQGINISKYFNNNETDLFDFYISKNNKYIEIKTISTEKNIVTMNIKQLTFKPKETSFVTVKIKEDKNGIKLLDVIDELLMESALDIYFKEYLLNIRIEVENDLFCEEIRFDKENIFFSIYLPNIIQSKVNLLTLMNNQESWPHIESIKLTIDLNGIKSESIEKVLEFLEE